DLDIETIRALEEAILNFAGSVMVVSHDRWFLDRVATHMMVYEDEGHVVWMEGNYTDYEADKRKRLGDEAAQPHRLKYKRLAH
ncbi:MAG: energy-dependent translational throttle protein EttA, partial [Nitrospirota bacterium]|nr:energy-dependent translational throttle protein EttA [Nitrospirota bacterium]